MDPNTLKSKLFATADGAQVDRLVRKLVKLGADDPETAIAILAEYAKKGSLNHWRGFIVPEIVRLVGEGDQKWRPFFEDALLDPVTAYWSVEGLIKTSGADSYERLTRLALRADNDTDVRSNAIKCLAAHSRQTFTAGLPSDPGQWKPEQLPVAELEQWAAAGYPAGQGFAAPPRHPDLDAPISELDRLARALEKKLAKARGEKQDPANPTNWLTPAQAEDLARIEARWQLPGLYVDFLRKFSPLRVNVRSRRFPQGLKLFGAHDLVERQAGYSFNPVENATIPDWPANYVVIAGMGGDPFVLDLSNVADGDAPVLTAEHGQGAWNFSVAHKGFLEFLRALAK